MKKLGALLSLLPAFFVSLLAPEQLEAEVFLLPSDNSESVVGEIEYTTARSTDTLIDIARRFDIGHDAIVKANPTVNRWVPERGTRIVIPSRYILPPTPREGITVNLAELRLYYYPKGSTATSRPVATYPVSIGRMDWRTPIGRTVVVRKERDPPWYPPPSIKAEHALEGEFLPDVIPGGHPANPLGKFALRLGIPGYLIHGVDERKAFGIGMRVTHGCIRMYPEDIERLFQMVDVGTPVYIIDEPVKVGWRGGKIFLEVHNPIDEEALGEAELYERWVRAMRLVWREAGGSVIVDEDAVRRVVRVGDGIPTPVASTKTGLPPARGSLFDDFNGENVESGWQLQNRRSRAQ